MQTDTKLARIDIDEKKMRSTLPEWYKLLEQLHCKSNVCHLKKILTH
jgi:hypothetical protein